MKRIFLITLFIAATAYGASRDQVISPTPERFFGKSEFLGVSKESARRDHTHGTPVNPTTGHTASQDPHTQYLRKTVFTSYTANDRLTVAVFNSYTSIERLTPTSSPASFPTLNQNTTGSAAKLTTARTINGVSFDGTANITVADSTKVALAGVAGGQTINGGTAAGETLMLKSTAHATKGKILFGTSAYDEVNNWMGIGTASPSYPLHIRKDQNSATFGAIQNSTSGTAAYAGMYVINNGGNGIIQRVMSTGFTSSGLDIANSGQIYADGGLTGGLILAHSGSAPLILGTNNTERIRILGTGNVGINTATPNAKLEVKGTGTTTGVNFQLLDSAAAVKFTVLDNGAVTAVNQITSSLATGTSPFAVTSTTKNTNLNADLWDGLHSTDVPNIKQNISLTAQVAAIGTTAITGTNTAGLYRVSYSLLDTTADLTAGTIMVNFTGTDEAGAFTMSSVALPLTALGRTQGTFFLRILGTGSVSYSTTLVGIIGTSQYGLFIAAEKIL